jgi:predicted acylesterase/phospholipase RssA
MGDYRVGLIRNPRLDLAVAVAASSAFPPFLSPVSLKLDPADFDPLTKGDLQFEPYTSNVILTDGGVYDNLGRKSMYQPHSQLYYDETVLALPNSDFGIEFRVTGDRLLGRGQVPIEAECLRQPI